MTMSRAIPLYHRQKQLLALIHEIRSKTGKRDFQKLLFLYCQESDSAPPYEFVPYHYGAFSFTSDADRRKLIERGLLADDAENWELTDFGRQIVSRFHTGSSSLGEFVRRYRKLRGDLLVAETYRRYPYYAGRSKIAGEVLRRDKVGLRRIEAERPERGSPGIATIGYERRSVEAYLNTLLKTGVTLLCDVRHNPVSRKYGFSKSTLKRVCEGVGLRYAHLPELGIASEQRRNSTTRESYNQLFDRYEREVLPKRKLTLERIAKWVQEGERVALTCYEYSPHQCHRYRVTKVLKRRFGSSFAAQHL